MTTDSPHFRTLAHTPTILRGWLDGMDPDAMVWKPAADRWSIREVLAHLADVERRNIFKRVRDIATLDDPEIIDYDQMVEYEKGTYSSGSGQENLDDLCAVREESLAFLREMPKSAWDRSATHHVVGTVTVTNLMSLWAFHDLSHIRQIAELKKAVEFWDGIGPLQHYYSVSP